MSQPPKACPNADCVAHEAPVGRWFWKRGYYKPRHNHQPVPRYQCRHCGGWFSATLEKPKRGQHRPELGARLLPLLVSGVNARRASVILGCSRSTVDRKIRHLVERVKAQHAAFLDDLFTGHVMLDELITFVHARPKQVSVAMVVRPSTGEVLGFTVCRLAAKGEAQQRRYDWWRDDRGERIPRLLRDLAPVLKPGAVVSSDAEPSYGKWIRQALPGCQHRPVKALVSKLAQKSKERDPLFAINLTFAKMRNDLARLGRKTWTTTKTIDGLERHLWLWVAWNNRYKIG
jgi:hypothetical protein